MRAESSGANCSTGGVKVEAGLDTDASGSLSDGEVAATQYVCDAGSSTTLVRTLAVPPGANCTHGGSQVQAGIDANHNNALDDKEVTTSTYVCNAAAVTPGGTGTNGRDSLVAFSPEPPGATCSAGGQKIEAGVDLDGSGVLTGPEITSTVYICNGAQGATGASGRDTLVQFATEPAGTNCPYGGQRIESGLDADRSGSLGAGEITSTAYACNAAPADTRWVEVTAAAQAQPNTGYLANSATNVNITLPANPQVGDWVKVTGVGAGGWTIVQNAAQRIGVSGLPGALTTSWTARTPTGSWTSVASSADGARLAAASASGELYTSSDSGVSWTPRLTGQPFSGVASSSDGQTLAAVTNGGAIYLSKDGGGSWTNDGSSRAWSSIAVSADGTRLVATAYLGQIWTSGDGGNSWAARESSRAWRSVSSSSDGRVLVAGTNGAQLYVSTDYGVTWTARASGQFWWSVASSADGQSLFATVDTGAIWASYDFGSTWEAQTSNRDWRGITSSADGSRVVAATSGGYLYESTDSGSTWRRTADTGAWTAVASNADGSRYIAGKSGSALYTGERRFYTTTGSAGSLSGGQNDALQLQYVGGGVFLPIGYLAASQGFVIR